MNPLVVAIFAALFLCLPNAWAELKIGYINSEQILNKYEGMKEANDKINKEIAKWEQEATKRQKEIKDLKEIIKNRSLVFSSERKKEFEDSLQAKEAQYHQFLQQKFGQNGETYSKNEELGKPIIEKINKALEKIGKEEGFDYIFDTRAGGVVFAKPGNDLTEKVLQYLNKDK